MAIELSELVVPLKTETSGFVKGLGVAGVAVGAVTALVVGSIKSTLDLAETYDDFGDKLGIVGSEASGFALVLKESGVSNDAFTKSMLYSGKTLTDVDGKLGTAAKTYQDLGVEIYNIDGTMRTATQLFADAAPAIAAIKDPTERARIEMQLYGKSGAELNDTIDMLSTKSLPEYSAEADKMGLTMSPERTAQIEQMGRKFQEFKASLMGVATTIGLAFMPVLDALMPVLSNLIGFISTNVVPWLQVYLPVAIQFLSNFWTTVLQPAIASVWAWMSTVLIPFLQTTVFPWLQTYIPIALQTLANFWTTVLQPAIATVWAWISGTLIPFFQNTVVPILQVVVPAAIKILTDAWNSVLLPIIKAVWTFLTVQMRPIWEVLRTLLGVTLVLALRVLTGIWQNILLPALRTIYNFIKDYVVPWFTKLSTGVSGVTSAIKTVVGWIQTLIDKLSNIKLPDWLTPGSPTPFELGLRGISSAMDDLSTYSLPEFTSNVNIKEPNMRNASARNAYTSDNVFDYEKLSTVFARILRQEMQRI